jgi:hypothetical protein
MMYISSFLLFLSTFFILALSSHDLYEVRCNPRTYISTEPARDVCNSALSHIRGEDEPIVLIRWPLRYSFGDCAIAYSPVAMKVTNTTSDNVNWAVLYDVACGVIDECLMPQNPSDRVPWSFNGGWTYVKELVGNAEILRVDVAWF